MNGSTSLVGIFGCPVAHSKSPAMHNAAFKQLDLNWAYLPLPVSQSESFERAVRGIAACGFKGANVTVPYKEQAARLVDEISDEVRAIGACNTLLIRPDQSIRGENTDARGFLAHLAEEKIDLFGKNVVVLGAGGAARAIVYALRKAGVSKLSVINRSVNRAEQLGTSFDIEVLDWSRSSFERASQADFIVNTTSLGLRESDSLPWDETISFSPTQVVYDAIYAKTPFLHKAIHDGARAITGAGMLLWQGAIAFELWTGREPPIDVMRRELQNA